MLLDRTKAPVLLEVEDFDIPVPQKTILPNGINLFCINMGNSDVMRIDLIFPSGKWDQNKTLIATFTNLLMKEGTKQLSSQKIAELLDYYGAWLQTSVTQHNSYIALYILNKHLESLLPILDAIVKEPIFPESEFETIVNRHRQQHIINREKVDHLCLEASVEQLYGKNHPYGKHVEEADFNNITTDDLKAFHHQHYRSENCMIMLTGKVTPEHQQLVTNFFGNQPWGENKVQPIKEYEIARAKDIRIHIPKPDAIQSAIRISAPTIARNHPDFNALRVLNTVFGGYFGSRLMTSIREEKGYTYGIGSSISSQQKGSTLTISTQTGSEYVEPLIEAVFEEMEKLKSKPIDSDELECVRSYLLGDFTRSFDGPFAIADAHISLLANQLDVSYYQNQMKAIRTINATTIHQMAQKYFDRNSFYIAIAGK